MYAQAEDFDLRKKDRNKWRHTLIIFSLSETLRRSLHHIVEATDAGGKAISENCRMKN